MFYRSKRRNDLDITKSRLAVIWFKTNEQQNSNFLRIIIFLSFAENSGRLPRVRLQQPQEQRYPFLTVRAVLSCVNVWSFNVRTYVDSFRPVVLVTNHYSLPQTKAFFGSKLNAPCLSAKRRRNPRITPSSVQGFSQRRLNLSTRQCHCGKIYSRAFR